MVENKSIRLALFFGGVSSEHEVSCVSAAAWLRALGQSPCAGRYDVTAVGITKEGRWLRYTGPADRVAEGSWQADTAHCAPCLLSPDRTARALLVQEDGVWKEQPVDAAVPVLHGKNGEDGTIQGLLELAGIPYVGCGVLASAVCMDKAVANTLMDAAGIDRCAWDWASRYDCADFEALEARLAAKLHYPIFVKPANAGSSVGISKAADKAELEKAIQVALAEDNKVVFERFVQGQEVECAVIGNEVCVSTRPGEILASEAFYTYEDKYVLGTSRTVIPAHLSEEVLDKVKAQAEKAYRALGCEGLARVDFFVENGDTILLNEINTLPGFTSISMYPKLMEAAGKPIDQLLDELIGLALQRAGVRHG